MPNLPTRTERWLPAAAALLFFSGLLCLAGDPIVFSNDKSKPDPGKEIQKDQERDITKPWRPAERSFDSELSLPMRTGVVGPRRLSKEEKQRRNAQEEKKNWLLLRPGQLQEDEERKSRLGVRDYDLQKPEDESAPRDYTFYGLGGGKKPDAKGRSSQGRSDSNASGDDQPRREEANREDDDDSARESSSKSSPLNQAGAHTASELDLKGLFNSGQKATRGSEKTDFTLRDLLSSTTPARSREQTERINAWRRDVLNAPDVGGSSPGLGDPVKSQTDFTRPSANPTFAKPLDTSAKSAPGGNSIFTPAGGFGLGGPVGSRGILAPGLPDARSLGTPNNLSPSYPGYGPANNLPDSQPALQRVQPTMLEVPRRKF